MANNGFDLDSSLDESFDGRDRYADRYASSMVESDGASFIDPSAGPPSGGATNSSDQKGNKYALNKSEIETQLGTSSGSFEPVQKEFKPAMDINIAEQQRQLKDNKRKMLKQLKEITDECMVCIEKNNNGKMSNILLSLPDGIQINDLIDNDGFTLLHMAVFKNKTSAAETLVKKAKKDIYQHQIAAWVNL